MRAKKRSTSVFSVSYIYVVSCTAVLLSGISCETAQNSQKLSIANISDVHNVDHSLQSIETMKQSKSETSNAQTLIKKPYNGNFMKKKPDHSFTRAQINPQNVRHPELTEPEGKSSSRRKQGRHHHLLPIMYPPVHVPVLRHHPGDYYPMNPYYSPIPYPNPYFRTSSGNGFGYTVDEFGRKSPSTNSLNPSYRSGVVRGTGYSNGQIQFPSPGMGRGDMYSREGFGGRIRQEEMPMRKTVEIEDTDGDKIISSKFKPCKGECEEDEFLCVGSCKCIPNAFRCDGDPDCEGEQDELECGETGVSTYEKCLETENYVRCPRSGKCIKKAWLCDGDDDCGDFSDETHCDGRNCTGAEFECSNGFCIQRSWVCDGDNDCKDFSDELNCRTKNLCSASEFPCKDGNCISLSWKCDFEMDCLDGSDEEECPREPHVCNENELECAYPRCVKKEFKCDGDNDCGDWSDEQNCPNTDSSCGPSEFKCNGGRCIPDLWRCDEETDCESGEDETGCSEKESKTCKTDEFTCSNGNCILKSWVCDTVQDCSKGEDEENCDEICHETQFKCDLHQKNNSTDGLNRKVSKSLVHCIGKKHVCDGKKDCPKGDDEKNCPKKIKCDPDTTCQQLCVVLSNGRKACSCEPGYVLSSDNRTCDDVDECKFEFQPVCSQMCTNTIGSYTCLCRKGYILRPDGRSCKAIGDSPTLLFANRIDIRQMSLNNLKYTAILRGLQNAIAIDYHYKKGWIYWSDVSMDVIKRAKINGTEKSDVIKWGLESPGGLAVDWVHDLLFWTDSGSRRIEVATLDGKLRSVIISNDLDKPRALVVHPGIAIMFWTDWGPQPKIEMSEMDGTNRKSIVTEGVFWPNGLALDYTVDRIYWTDAKHHTIESAKLDGADRKKIVSKGLPHPFAITLFEEEIYWTDWHTKSIASANKDTGTGYQIVHTGLHFPMDIHSFHSQRQPTFRNRCGKKNGGCSHLCLPTQSSYKCVCPLGLRLHTNKKTCTDTPEKLLIFTRKKDIRLRELGPGKEIGQIDIVIPLDRIRSAVALAFDSDENMIYWSDVEVHRISRSFLNGSDQEVIVENNLKTPAGMAVDWVTKKLYWTDAGTNRIEVSNLNGSMRCLLIWENLDKPRDIVVNPISGYMYFSDWGKSPKIEQAEMNGSNRRTFFSKNLIWPNGLTIDYEKNRLYWVDGGTKAIEYSNLDGTGRTLLKISGTEIRHPFGLALNGNTIFYTDWETNSIHFADKNTGKNGAVLREKISGLMDVRVFHREFQKVQSPCLVYNGGCSHLCLLAPPPRNYSCACPIGIQLLNDEKTCSAGPTNYLIIAHRVDIRRISLDVPYIADTVLPLPPMKNTRGIDVDRKTGEIYWTDTVEDVIMRASQDGTHVERLISYGLDTADGIVLDSTGRKIYWTDSGRNSIEVCELNGSNRKVLIWSDLENPRAIVLHYHLGLMFWSDWGKKAKIEQADMDGKNRKTIVSDNLHWPNGLAIDRPASRLYWNDGKKKAIESSDLKGCNRKIVVREVPNPYGLVIVGTHIYWTDWKTQSVHRADKHDGNDSQVIKSDLDGLMDIRSVQMENIAENACGENNGGCSHLCLRNPNGFSCACPTGILLESDNKTCMELPSAYLLFAARTRLIRVSLDTPELWDVALPIKEIQNSIAVDFHWKNQMIYYTDVTLDVIRGVNMKNLSDNRAIISENIITPDGLAVDWLAENIFWTDTSRKVLEVARLDGTSRRMIFDKGLDDPRAIAVYPMRGYLFWTDWGEFPKIGRSYMDGSQRKSIVTLDLGFPNGLALDYDAEMLYWADALKDRIEMSDIDGGKRMNLVPTASHPFGLSMYGGHIYWTDWFSKSVERVNQTTGDDRISIRTGLKNVMEIKAVSASSQTGWSPCQESNGLCSHLCLFREIDYVCACPDIPDDRPCERDPKLRVTIAKNKDFEDYENRIMEENKNNELGKIQQHPDIKNNGLLNTKNHDLEPNADLGDVGVYNRNPGGNLSGPGSQSRQKALIIATVVLGTLLVLMISVWLVLRYNERKKKLKSFIFTYEKNVLTFSNPNYNGSEVGAVSDRRPFLWRKFRYDKAQEKVYVVREETSDSGGGSDTMSSGPQSSVVKLVKSISKMD